MKSIEEIRDWLLKNAVDDDGNLNLRGLNLSNFDGNVYIDFMKVKRSLHQDYQDVGESLWQGYQKVGENLYQDGQTVGKDFYNHKLENNEYWDESEFYVVRRKKLKEITLEELEKMGFKLKEEK